MDKSEDKPDAASLTEEEIRKWFSEETACLHPADDFEGPRLTFLSKLCDMALASIRPEYGALKEACAIGLAIAGHYHPDTPVDPWLAAHEKRLRELERGAVSATRTLPADDEIAPTPECDNTDSRLAGLPEGIKPNFWRALAKSLERRLIESTRSTSGALPPADPEAEALKKDAARWRFLRHDSGHLPTETRKHELVEVYMGTALDEKIDKLMTPVSARQERQT